jgi:hypothetical protein
MLVYECIKKVPCQKEKKKRNGERKEKREKF